MAHIIVVGNEKGGSGKSTTAVHLIVALLGEGLRVGSIDLDARQRTLTRFFENRAAFARRKDVALSAPLHRVVPASDIQTRDAAQAEESDRLQATLAEMGRVADVVVIDCPGTDSHLSRLGHSLADTLLTPLNDSFIDLDLLATLDAETYAIVRPSRYSEMVWESRKKRWLRDRANIDWVLMRNRLSQIEARNKQRIGQALDSLAGRIGFRLAPGLSERVIYRELFLSGLTVMDLGQAGIGGSLKVSQIAARNEVRALRAMLDLPASAPLAAGSQG